MLLSPPLLFQPDDYETLLTHGDGLEAQEDNHRRSRAMTGLLKMPRTYARIALANGNGGSTVGLLKNGDLWPQLGLRTMTSLFHITTIYCAAQ